MGDVGELLELLHGARDRYATARGALRHWSRLSLAERARERWEEQLRRLGHGSATSYAVFATAGPPEAPPDRHELLVRSRPTASARSSRPRRRSARSTSS